MMKKSKKIALLMLIPFISSLCSCDLVNIFPSESEESNSSIVVSDSSEEDDDSSDLSESTSSGQSTTEQKTGYYKDIDETVGSTKLLEDLQTLMFNTHKHYTTYGQIRNLFFYSDADPKVSGNILSFYSRISIDGRWDGTTYNREHVWPQAKSGGLFQDVNNNTLGAGSDLHHIRPTIISENTERGNKIFGSEYTPTDDVKGDCARICLYLYAHYSNRINGSGSNRSSYVGNLILGNVFTTNSVLKQWNELDPVDELERARNEYCYSLQGNRNPFIDHPEWVNKVI